MNQETRSSSREVATVCSRAVRARKRLFGFHVARPDAADSLYLD